MPRRFSKRLEGFVQGAQHDADFRRDGVQTAVVDALKQRNVPCDRLLDCHGMTVQEAFEAWQTLRETMLSLGERIACVVHGQGRSDPSIRTEFRRWLAHDPAVLASTYAHPRRGGEGATMVRLKAKRHAT